MRLFLALRPPEVVSGLLSDFATSVAHRFGGRPTRRDTLHMTLVFIGEISSERLVSVQEVCRVVCADGGTRQEAFAVTIDQLAFWPHKRMFWAGCSQRPPGLFALVSRLRHCLVEAAVPVDGLEQAFVPHVTLVRRVPNVSVCEPACFSDVFRAFFPSGLPAWPCSELALVESRLDSDGATHRVLASYPFG